MHSDEKDSLTRLIEDVEKTAALGDCAYWDRGENNNQGCDGCPSDSKDLYCYKPVLEDVARRLHALMPHDADGREIKAGDVIAEHCREQGTEYLVEGFRVVPTTSCNVCITHAPTLCVVSDSWERLERDAALGPRDYLIRKDPSDRRYGFEAMAAMAEDLVTRAKALAGVKQ